MTCRQKGQRGNTAKEHGKKTRIDTKGWDEDPKVIGRDRSLV